MLKTSDFLLYLETSVGFVTYIWVKRKIMFSCEYEIQSKIYWNDENMKENKSVCALIVVSCFYK